MKVLIVDDEAHVREAIEYLIDWDKYHIQERWFASNVTEAEQIIKEKKPEILFCDIKMPEKSGIELIKEIREKEKNIEIIVISGYDDFEYMRAVIQAQAIDYILKPVKKEELEKALDKAIEARKEREIVGDFKKILELDELEKVSSKGNVIEEIKEYIEEHYHEKITLDLLAKEFYLSPQYISSMFKENYNVTIVEYVTFLKIEKAKKLLLETDMSILDIAYLLGFSNENYFSKVFKKHVNMPPKYYRENYLGKKNG